VFGSFDAAALGRPTSVMRGHNKTINALAVAGGRWRPQQCASEYLTSSHVKALKF
jgi:hypothetical protein